MNRWDRIGHCLAFFFLTLILKNFLNPLVAFIIAWLIGLLNEIYFSIPVKNLYPKKWYSPFDWHDLWANTIGCYSASFFDFSLTIPNIIGLAVLWVPLSGYILTSMKGGK